MCKICWQGVTHDVNFRVVLCKGPVMILNGLCDKLYFHMVSSCQQKQRWLFCHLTTKNCRKLPHYCHDSKRLHGLNYVPSQPTCLLAITELSPKIANCFLNHCFTIHSQTAQSMHIYLPIHIYSIKRIQFSTLPIYIRMSRPF